MILTEMYSTSIKSVLINTILFFAVAQQLSAQVVQTNRFEISLDDQIDLEIPKATSIGNEGVLVHRRLRGRLNDQIELTKLDTAFRENWKGSIPVEKSITLAATKSKYQIVYLLFRSAVYGNFDFHLVAMNSRTGNFTRYLIKNLIPFGPTEFHITNNAILIGGYFNSRPVVLHFGFNTERSKLLPGFFNEPGEIDEIKTYENGLVDIMVSLRNIQHKKVIWLRSYSSDGDLLNSSVLEGDGNKYLLAAKSFRRADDKLMVTGVFGQKNVEYSRGYFTAEIEGDGTAALKYFYFYDLENFFSFMKPKREARIKERVTKRKEKGRKIRVAYRFLVHELIPHQNQIILLSESYYPKYIYSNPYSTYGGYRYYNYTGVRGERIFDGYRYTHASIIGINKDGDITWDNTFEMNDIKIFSLNQFIKARMSGNDMKMVYSSRGYLKSKVIREAEVVEPKAETPLTGKSKLDLIKDRDTETTTLVDWYNPYFMVSGVQYVQNRAREGGNRKVFFITKLKFQ